MMRGNFAIPNTKSYRNTRISKYGWEVISEPGQSALIGRAQPGLLPPCITQDITRDATSRLDPGCGGSNKFPEIAKAFLQPTLRGSYFVPTAIVQASEHYTAAIQSAMPPVIATVLAKADSCSVEKLPALRSQGNLWNDRSRAILDDLNREHLSRPGAISKNCVGLKGNS